MLACGCLNVLLPVPLTIVVTTTSADCVNACIPLLQRHPLSLTGGPTRTAGRLELFKNGMWAAVDAHSIPNAAAIAQVACRQLGGYTGFLMEWWNTFHDPTVNVQWQGLACDGSESSLADCTTQWLQADNAELAITCFNPNTTGRPLTAKMHSNCV